jgi:hypothetical protein
MKKNRYYDYNLTGPVNPHPGVQWLASAFSKSKILSDYTIPGPWHLAPGLFNSISTD